MNNVNYLALQGVGAVSYTHLDVYKRQFIYSADENKGSVAGNKAGMERLPNTV